MATIPSPAETDLSAVAKDTITLGGGCFWCLEAVFELVEGVHAVRSGYAGGHRPDPTYEQVCTGTTGHAEVVQIDFDPEVIPVGDLLEIFFGTHDPTTLNRQGGDRGTQYRSVIFTHDESQDRTSREVIAELETQKIWDAPIVTEVRSLDTFFPAESYHREYFRRNPGTAYCQAVVGPKVAKFRKGFSHRLRTTPTPTGR